MANLDLEKILIINSVLFDIQLMKQKAENHPILLHHHLSQNCVIGKPLDR